MEIGWQRLTSPDLDGILRVEEAELAHVTTAADLTKRLLTKLRAQDVDASHAALKFYGKTLSGYVELAPLIPTLCSGGLRWTLRVTVADKGVRSYIFVKTSGRAFKLDISLNATVKELKARVANMENISVEQDNLFFNGKLLEDGSRLADNNIMTESLVYFTFRLRGGGEASFVDVEDDDAMRTVAFASSAPSWRVVAQGLNLHGTCLNRACVACDKEVIAPIGLKPFNIIAQQASCPMCKCAIAARTCGFYNCEWRFEGVKAKTGVHVASAWKTLPSHDAYNLFDDDDSNMALWRSLVLVVQRRSSSQTCALCKGDADGERTPCGHMHRRCVQVWIDSSATRRAIGANCSECHVSID